MTFTPSEPLPPFRNTGDPDPAADVNLLTEALREVRAGLTGSGVKNYMGGEQYERGQLLLVDGPSLGAPAGSEFLAVVKEAFVATTPAGDFEHVIYAVDGQSVADLEARVTVLEQEPGTEASGISPSGDVTGATDRAAIQAIINAGKNAFLTDGHFYIGSTLIIKTECALRGAGRGRTLIEAVGATPIRPVSIGAYGSSSPVTNAEVSDLTIKGNTTVRDGGQSVLEVIGAQDFAVRRVETYGGVVGILVAHGQGFTRDGVIEDCYAHDTYADGISVFGGVRVTLRRNRSFHTGDDGMALNEYVVNEMPPIAAAFASAAALSNALTGYGVPTSVEAAGALIDGPVADLITFLNQLGGSYTEQQASALQNISKGVPYPLENNLVEDCVIEDCVILDSGSRGISLLGGDRNTARDNVIDGTFVAGISVVSEPGFTTCRNPTVEGNRISNAGSGDDNNLDVPGSGEGFVAGVLLQASVNGSDRITGARISGNVIKDPRGPYLMSVGDGVIEDTEISENRLAGERIEIEEPHAHQHFLPDGGADTYIVSGTGFRVSGNNRPVNVLPPATGGGDAGADAWHVVGADGEPQFFGGGNDGMWRNAKFAFRKRGDILDIYWGGAEPNAAREDGSASEPNPVSGELSQYRLAGLGYPTGQDSYYVPSPAAVAMFPDVLRRNYNTNTSPYVPSYDNTGTLVLNQETGQFSAASPPNTGDWDVNPGYDPDATEQQYVPAVPGKGGFSLIERAVLAPGEPGYIEGSPNQPSYIPFQLPEEFRPQKWQASVRNGQRNSQSNQVMWVQPNGWVGLQAIYPGNPGCLCSFLLVDPTAGI